jgi:hypothetical protein
MKKLEVLNIGLDFSADLVRFRVRPQSIGLTHLMLSEV